jgi:hypothetical protein
MAKNLWQKRKSAFLQIAAFSGGNIVLSGAPKPTIEVPTAVVLTGADFVMCGMIHNVYFGEEIDKMKVLKVLGVAGAIVLVAGGGGYALAKGASGLVAEVTNWMGPVGWIASGLLAAGATAILGLTWMAICDYAYRKDLVVEAAAAALAH